MKTIGLSELRSRMNELGQVRAPFYFVTSFDLQRNHIIPSIELEKSPLHFSFHSEPSTKESITVDFEPLPYSHYKKAFDKVKNEIQLGNSFLVNLTQPTEISIDKDLIEIYREASAPFKMMWEDKFVVFSPEAFVRINKGRIYSYPMKGTISASVPNAREKLLGDIKESAEHATIVDLIRNDLSKHASDVTVEKFKYLDSICTSRGEILQMSSKIGGDLSLNYHSNIGDIVLDMLPAGSVSGAPKEKTLSIIKEAENYDRGYYCGVSGYFDGDNLESFVMIRFIEKNDGYVYKSGGGITHLSKPEMEYKELLEKIYVPIH